MRTNYVMVDYENVQPESLAGLEAPHFRTKIFAGNNQKKLPMPLVKALLKLGDRAEIVEIAGAGRNALDFHIAFQIGRISKDDPDAFFHIISKDEGFDPLIRHLKDNNIFSRRSSDIAEIPLLKVEGCTEASSRLKVVVENLHARGNARPATLKTLASSVNALFGKKLSEQEVAELLAALKQKGWLAVDGNKVSYKLPEPSGG